MTSETYLAGNRFLRRKSNGRPTFEGLIQQQEPN